MKKPSLLAVAAVTAVTASVAAYYGTSRQGDAPKLLTTTITKGDVVETVAATGTLQAVTTVQVGTQVSGTIKALHADFNSRVRKGQIIAELDPSLMQAQVDQAQASVLRLQADVDRAHVQVEDAQTKLKRARDLFARQLLPAADLDTAETTLREAEATEKSAAAQVVQARASLNQNHVNLEHTVIRAPIDGVVISRSVDVGQTVAASMSAPTLFVIAKDLTRMQVNASVDESDIGRIRNGQAIAFRVDAYPNETFSGTVTQVRLDPVVQQNVVSYVTVIDVPNPAEKLKPGMTANVTVEIARADDVIGVPNSALRFRPTPDLLAELGQQPPNGVTGSLGERRAPADRNGSQHPSDRANRGRVWVLANGRLEPVSFRAGINDGVTTAVLDGPLAEGTQVVTGVAAAQTASNSAAAGGSPLLPRFPRGNRSGGAGTPGGQR